MKISVMMRTTAALAFLLAIVACDATSQKDSYELVIQGGRVMDPETGLDAIRDIGINGDTIIAISADTLTGNKTIDAQGMIVAPGFIDLHAHGQQTPAARMQAFDGVTTALELESGLLPVAEYYQRLEKEKRPLNYGTSASWVSARIAVMESIEPEADLVWFQKAFSRNKWQNTVATPEQLEKILALVEEGLEDGGIGIGINAGYAPGSGAKEFFALGELAAKHGAPTYTHIRSFSSIDPNSSFEAYMELAAVATTTGAHMHICHLNSTSTRDPSVFPMLKAAQESGANITIEAYPYGAASTAVGAEIFRGNWRERTGAKASDIEFEGDPLNDKSLEDFQRDNPGAPIVFHYLREDSNPEDKEQLDRSVLYPGGAIASDAMPWAMPDGSMIEGDVWPMPEGAFAHPRSSGTFTRFLRTYVRERDALPLMEALEKASLIPAQILEKSTPQMAKKGRLQVGMDADIVVFDMETVSDKGTYTEPAQTAVGMKHVLVNGVPLIEDGNLDLEAFPGKAIRRL